MGNILDYIEWRGDLSFDIAPFNEVDNLILSELSYIDFENIVDRKNDREVPLYRAVEEYFMEERDKEEGTGNLVNDNLFKLIRMMADSRRYSQLRLKKFVRKNDEEREMQFSAMTIDLLNGHIYIAFRGTDDTLLGWKEDFKMSVLDVVPSQREALKYLKQAAIYNRGQKMYIGGHSKGGNLAVYAAVKAGEGIKKDIVKVYNNDGPGFKESLINTDEYKTISDRIMTIVPQSSIIGMLLEHEENYNIVKSSQKGILQHDGISWEVSRDSFIYLQSVTKESEILDITLKRFLNELSDEKKIEFTNALFEVLSSNDRKNVSQLKLNGIKSFRRLFKEFDSLEESVKKMLMDTITLFISEGIKSYTEINSNEAWKDKVLRITKK